MFSQPKSRQILRSAIAERDLRQKRFATAQVALARAELMLCEAEAHLREFADVDEAISLNNAEGIKTRVRSGGKPPKMSVPENLLARRKGRDAVRAQVAAAKSVATKLLDEANAARSVLAEANFAVSEAAQAIIFEEASAVATRLRSVNRERWLLANQLRGLAELWLPTTTNQTMRPARLPQSVLESLAEQEPQYGRDARPEVKHTAAWRALYTALLTDAEATLPVDL